MSHSFPTRRASEPQIELVPFSTTTKSYDDEAGRYYIPAGDYLPPQPEQRRFDGPGWADTRYVAGNHGLIARYVPAKDRSEEHTSELQSLMRISYAVFCLKKKLTHAHPLTLPPIPILNHSTPPTYTYHLTTTIPRL